MPSAFFRYRFDLRFAPLWLPLGARPRRDGVRLSDDEFRATLGVFKLVTSRANVVECHITEGYRWFKAIGARLSAADDGLTFGTNAERGVCVHFRDRVGPVLGVRPHSAVTVTVEDCEGLVAALERVLRTPRDRIVCAKPRWARLDARRTDC